MLKRPTRKDTPTGGNGRVWFPATAEAFVEELQTLYASAAAAQRELLFRGHAHTDWVIDSKISRTAKTLFGFAPGARPLDEAADNQWFIGALYGIFHFKFGGMGRPSQDLLDLEMKEPLIDPWFEYMRWLQQFPENDRTPLGSFLIDWSKSYAVATWFAANSEAADGAVFVFDYRAAGAAFFTEKLAGLLGVMERHDWSSGQISDRPLIFSPKKQIAQRRPKAQQAVYIAQRDLRWPIERAWARIEQETSQRLFVKIILPGDEKTKVLAMLEEEGVTKDALFPDFHPGEST